MTLKEENKMLRLICEVQQRAIRHFTNYLDTSEDVEKVEALASSMVNANNARQMCDLLAIPPGDAPDRDHDQNGG